MEKDFRSWFEIKELLDARSVNGQLFCKEKEIWVCSIGTNIGSEQDGHGPRFSRPVLILRTLNQDTFWGFPLTSKPHSGNYYFRFNLGGIDSFVIFSQIRTFSVNRLERKITEVDGLLFKEIVDAFRKLLP